MNEDWTPGPYRVDPNSNCDIQTADGELEIASTHPGLLKGGRCPEGTTPQDNAALLAASWDMAEALEDIGRQIDRDPYTTPDFTRAERALAKAKGEEE